MRETEVKIGNPGLDFTAVFFSRRLPDTYIRVTTLQQSRFRLTTVNSPATLRLFGAASVWSNLQFSDRRNERCAIAARCF
jgi:hypothetical protein